MKPKIHPENYRPVVFRDASVGAMWRIGSTVETKKTIVWSDGIEYPLFDVEVSSASHQFYTGKQRILDTEGRIEKFQKKYGRSREGAEN